MKGTFSWIWARKNPSSFSLHSYHTGTLRKSESLEFQHKVQGNERCSNYRTICFTDCTAALATSHTHYQINWTDKENNHDFAYFHIPKIPASESRVTYIKLSKQPAFSFQTAVRPDMYNWGKKQHAHTFKVYDNCPLNWRRALTLVHLINQRKTFLCKLCLYTRECVLYHWPCVWQML